MIKILVIDDDLELTDLLAEFFLPHQITVASRRSPTLGLNDIRTSPPDIVIVDIMLPEMNGFDLCRRIRSFSKIPIIMLTARGGVADRIKGLEQGADDYLSKPFDPKELLARVHTVLRRSNFQPEGSRQVNQVMTTKNGLIIDPLLRTVTLLQNKIQLTSAEFDALIFLCSQAGNPISRDAISTCLKGKDWDGSSRSIDLLLSRLRQKLGDDPHSPRFIKTLRSKGYLFLDRLIQNNESTSDEARKAK